MASNCKRRGTEAGDVRARAADDGAKDREIEGYGIAIRRRAHNEEGLKPATRRTRREGPRDFREKAINRFDDESKALLVKKIISEAQTTSLASRQLLFSQSSG